MAANDFAYASVPLPGDLTVKNTDSVDFVAGNVVKVDATNVVSGTQSMPGALRATTDDYAFGVCMEAIAQGKAGRIRTIGIAQAVSSAAVSAGAIVEASTVGKVVTAGAAKPQLGQALTATSADGDKLLVLLAIAKNA